MCSSSVARCRGILARGGWGEGLGARQMSRTRRGDAGSASIPIASLSCLRTSPIPDGKPYFFFHTDTRTHNLTKNHLQPSPRTRTTGDQEDAQEEAGQALPCQGERRVCVTGTESYKPRCSDPEHGCFSRRHGVESTPPLACWKDLGSGWRIFSSLLAFSSVAAAWLIDQSRCERKPGRG